nr:hypothetical protein Iba_chr04bCG2240 [Ipomoea batatas]
MIPKHLASHVKTKTAKVSDYRLQRYSIHKRRSQDCCVYKYCIFNSCCNRPDNGDS